jgi:prepilin-type N-terminal cleavage/methylation domain-containing protein
MRKKWRDFNREFISGSYGMTLTEVLVAVAITSVVLVFAFNLITDFTRQAWEHESKARMTDEAELAANVIKSQLPQFITSVTGPLGTDAPPANFWVCTSSDCKMSITYKYKNLNGDTSSSEVNPIRAKCESIQDARLATAGVGLNTKATGSLGAAKCLECPVGKAPRISLDIYDFDATSGAPTVTGTMDFPKNPEDVGRSTKQGALAMGICVDWPGYSYNAGNGLTDTRYDNWVIIAIPVWAYRTLHARMTEPEIRDSFYARPPRIQVSPNNRFAPDFRFIPYR